MNLQRIFCLAVMATLAGWSSAGSAQLADSATVPILVSITDPPPAITIERARSIDFGTVFRSRLDDGGCVYEVRGDGTVPAPRESNGRTAVAGCGFSNDQTPTPGRIALTCTVGGAISYTATLQTGTSLRSAIMRNPTLFLRDSAEARIASLPVSGGFACPPGGLGFIDVGIQVEVRRSTSSADGQITLSATIS